MPTRRAPPPLARREREIMEVVYRLKAATAADITANLANPPSYSAVRALLTILESKGHLRHESSGTRYVYMPTVSHERAGRRALREVVANFFQGSPRDAVVALIDHGELSADDVAEIRRQLDAAVKDGR
jgi:predicted transcriptional regulator